MDWNAVVIAINTIINDIRKEQVLQNDAIRDDIFSILEKNCTVLYYPLQNEKNRGFHVKRIVNDKLEDFVFINTDKAIDEQIFAYHRGRMEKIKGTQIYCKYEEMTKDKELVIGNTANDRMFFVIDNFFIGNITDAAQINSLSALELGKQYVAVTEKRCDAVRIEKIPVLLRCS